MQSHEPALSRSGAAKTATLTMRVGAVEVLEEGEGDDLDAVHVGDRGVAEVVDGADGLLYGQTR